MTWAATFVLPVILGVGILAGAVLAVGVYIIVRRGHREDPEQDSLGTEEITADDVSADLNGLKDSIQEMKDVVSSTPNFAVEGQTSEALKARLDRVLMYMEKTTRDFEPVLARLAQIQNLVLRPVKREIIKTARQNKLLSSLGIVFGVMGLLLTAISVINPMVRGGGAQSVGRSPSSVESPPPGGGPHARSEGSIPAELAPTKPGQPNDEIDETIRALEKLLTGPNPDKREVDQYWTKLAEGDYDAEAKAAATYGASLCAAFEGLWYKIRNAEPKEKGLANTRYSFAVRAYIAEAYAHDELLDDAINRYQQLEGVTTARLFLSPSDFHRVVQPVDAGSFVTGRLTDLKARRDLADVHIGVYDVSGGRLADVLVTDLKKKGLVNADPAPHPWQTAYDDRPYICYRSSDSTCETLGKLVDSELKALAPRPQRKSSKCMHYRSRHLFETELNANQQWNYLVILPAE